MSAMNLKGTIFRLAVAAELLAISAFLYAAWREDQAMDKSGLGDYGQFAWWDHWATLAFWVALAIWPVGSVIGLVLDRAGVRAPFGNSSFVLFCLGAPVTFVVVYVGLLALN